MQTFIWKSISTIHKIKKYFKVYHFLICCMKVIWQNSTTIYEFLKGNELSTEVNLMWNQYDKKYQQKNFS